MRLLRLIPAWFDLQVQSDAVTPRPEYYNLDAIGVLIGAAQWGVLAFVWDRLSLYRRKRKESRALE